MKNPSAENIHELESPHSPTSRDLDAERMSFLNGLEMVSHADLLPNYDGTLWFVKRDGGPFSEVLYREGAKKSRKLDVDDVVLLRSGALLGDGRKYFRINCEGQKVVLTPVYSEEDVEMPGDHSTDAQLDFSGDSNGLHPLSRII